MLGDGAHGREPARASHASTNGAGLGSGGNIPGNLRNCCEHARRKNWKLGLLLPGFQQVGLPSRCRIQLQQRLDSSVGGTRWKRQINAMCHVWTAPSWQGLSSRLQHWSVQPCVRPLDAVHMTADALRGSGPGQNPAFDNALAHLGCPDRRIDRLCITCCSPPNLQIAPECRRDLVTPPVRRVPCSAHLLPSSPRPSGRSCWRARLPRPSLAAALVMRSAKADAWCRES